MKEIVFLILFAGIFFLVGCTTNYSADPAVGCWYKSILGLDSWFMLNADHTYTEYGLGSINGKWERNGTSIELYIYKPSTNSYIHRSTLLYHEETDSLYYRDYGFSRVDCNSLRTGQ